MSSLRGLPHLDVPLKCKGEMDGRMGGQMDPRLLGGLGPWVCCRWFVYSAHLNPNSFLEYKQRVGQTP